MARLLLEDGHQLIVFNRTRAKTEALAGLGAQVAETISEVASSAYVVVTMLSDDEALGHVVDAEGGLLASLPPGGIHVAMGTHSAGRVRALARVHRNAGQHLISAPMLGRPEAVAARQASMVVAGDQEAVDRARPALASMVQRIFEAGSEPEAAATMKIANNFMLGCAIEALGEAFSLVQKWGGAPDVFQEMVAGGMFACPAYTAYSKIIADQRYEGAGFTATLGLKDANLALAAGAIAGVPLPSGSVWRDRLLGAIAHGNEDHDWATMALEQARASGLVGHGVRQ